MFNFITVIELYLFFFFLIGVGFEICGKNGFHSGIVKNIYKLLSNLLFFFIFFHIKLVGH